MKERGRGRPAKPGRVRVVGMVKPETKMRLERVKVGEALDGFGAVLDETVNLLDGQDAALEAAKLEIQKLQSERAAVVALAGEQRREILRLTGELARVGAKRGRHRKVSCARCGGEVGRGDAALGLGACAACRKVLVGQLEGNT